jgi:hypothetical protein
VDSPAGLLAVYIPQSRGEFRNLDIIIQKAVLSDNGGSKTLYMSAFENPAVMVI